MIHFVFASKTKGRILSGTNSGLGAAPSSDLTRLCVACDEKIGLPEPTQVHGLTPVPQAVTCPACQATPEFLKEYKRQTGTDFKVAGAPADTTTTPVPQSPPA